MLVLGLSADPGNDGGAEALGRDDTQAADPAADGNVDEHVLVAPSGAGVPGGNDGADEDDASVDEKSRGYDVFLHGLDVCDGRGLGGVEDNDDGPDDTQEACDLADYAQALLEENGREDGSNDNRESAQGRDEEGVGKGIGDKVANLADNHENHAGPPVKVLKIAVALAGDFVIFFVGSQESDFFENKGDADEAARANSQTNTDGLVVPGPLAGGASEAA